MTMLLALRLFTLGAIFLIAVAAVFLMGNVFARNTVVRRRLEAISDNSDVLVPRSSLRGTDRNAQWSKIIEAIEKTGISLIDTNNDRVRQRLIAAGYTSPDAPRIFTLVRLGLTLLLPTLFVLVSLSGSQPPSLLKLYLLGALIALAGLYVPNLFISAKAARRQEEIVNGFPDALDLMLVCVEAGLGMEAALNRVGREIALSHPLISQVFGKVVLELRAGRSRTDALRGMADELGIEEIRSFATLLIQSDLLGSSVGNTLRIYAVEMRERRRMRAEEKAHRLPVLLSIPLVACMLPVMIGILILPAAIHVVRELLPVLAGG